MLRFLRHRVTTLIAVALAVLVATVAPSTPAQAAYGPPTPFYVQVVSDTGRLLTWVNGFVQFDSGRTRFYYSVDFCRGSAYQAPKMDVYVNRALHHTRWHNEAGTAPTPQCNLEVTLDREVEYGSPVQEVRFVLVAIYFDGSTAREFANGVPITNPYF